VGGVERGAFPCVSRSVPDELSLAVGATLARTLSARRDDEVGGSERRTEKLSRISRVGRARGEG